MLAMMLLVRMWGIGCKLIYGRTFEISKKILSLTTFKIRPWDENIQKGLIIESP